jgi:RHS repeat-associated protein
LNDRSVDAPIFLSPDRQDDELVDTTDRDGRRTTYGYDADGRETGESWLSGTGTTLELITYSYDNVGRMTGATDPNAVLTFTYDKDGELTNAGTQGLTGQPTVTLTYGYDPGGNLTSVTDNLSSIGRTTYVYDAANRLTTITQSFGGTAGPQVLLGYDPGNRLTSINRTIGGTGTAVTTSLAYDTANRLTTITSQVAGGSSLASYAYQYDPGDRVIHESNTDGAYTYTYNADNELTGVSGTHTESYSYDSTGNRNSTGYTTGTDNETTAAPNTTYTYDGEGNLTSETNTSTHVTTSFSYDYRDRLTTVSVGGVIQATYTYDALNRRIGTDLAGTQTWTVYSGNTADDNVYADFSSSGALTERYLYGPAVDELFARTSASGTSAWYLTDRLGSVRDIASTSGTVIDHVVYDTYGNIVSESNATNGDRFKWAGMAFDAAIGLYFDKARYYDPVTGRFIKQDPAGFGAGDVNLYRYTENDPTDLADLNGEQDFLDYIPVVGTLGALWDTTSTYSRESRRAVELDNALADYNKQRFAGVGPVPLMLDPLQPGAMNAGSFHRANGLTTASAQQVYSNTGVLAAAVAGEQALQAATDKLAGKVLDAAGDLVDAARARNAIKAGQDVPIGTPNNAGPRIVPDKQGKHIPGHKNFIPGRSPLTHPDPQGLLDRFAGTGQAVGAIPSGQPGFKERVDFGEIIGQVNGQPTTKGIIHYAKDGAHIVPANP